MGDETRLAQAVEGMIFDIQHFSIHDGPGIRSTVFLKGCPLSCRWCQNPESQSAVPEVMFHGDRCVACGACVAACTEGAVSIVDGRSSTDRTVCAGRGECATVCAYEARIMAGRNVTAGHVFERVAADKLFYDRSDGGVTLSGGEPLAQPDFSRAIFSLCKGAGLHTALDTSGYARWDTVRDVLRYVDLVLYDLKHMDSAEHKKLTGVPNEVILENARRVHSELGLPILARVPIVPGYNDTAANLEATARFIAEELGEETSVHLHPYHRLGEGKYGLLERADGLESSDIPSDEHMRDVQALFASRGLHVAIGG